MKWGRFISLPVIAVLALSSFVYYVTVFIFIDDWLGLQSSGGALNGLIFSLLASLTLFSFFTTVLTDPGRVPAGFLPDLESSAEKLDVKQRICDKCSEYKPPRTHHCRSCRTCILRMDHHCSWINNCVGHRNYKAFFVLILYATVASIYSSVTAVSCTLQKDWKFPGNAQLKFVYIASGMAIMCLTITLATLLGWHIYLVIHNQTTIEHYEAERAAWLARKSGQNYRHPFDVGVYKNITLVLGPNMLKWLWPTASSHIKDGINFPTIRDGS